MTEFFVWANIVDQT